MEIWHPLPPSRATRAISARSQGSARAGLDGPTHRILAESGLEYKIAYRLLAEPDVVDLWEQPPAVPYVGEDGVARSHTFDFLVYHRDGSTSAVEVKPECRADKARKQVALIAKQAPKFADTFIVMTEVDVDPIRAHDGRLIHDMRRLFDPASDAAVAAIVRDLSGTTTVSCIVATSGLGAAAFGAVVRLVGSGHLLKVDGRRLDYPSRIRRSSGPARMGAIRNE